MNRQLGSVEQYPQPIILYQRRGSLVMFIKIEEVLSGVYELTPYNKQVSWLNVNSKNVYYCTCMCLIATLMGYLPLKCWIDRESAHYATIQIKRINHL